MLNDVIEQGYKQMINYPDSGEELNRIINEASEEINQLTARIDAHQFGADSLELKSHYEEISTELHQKSLRLLGRLQSIRRGVPTRTS